MKPHLPESKFEEMVIFSKRAVIFPAAQWEVLEMAAGMQLSTLTQGLTESPGRSWPEQGSSDAVSKLVMT